MEKLHLKTTKGKVRIIGAMLCLAGALIISLYKGSLLISGQHQARHPTLTIPNKIKPDWTHGTILLVASVLSYATWFIVQVSFIYYFEFAVSSSMF